MKVFVALCLLSVAMAKQQVAFPSADLIKRSRLGIQHPSQRLIDEAHAGESRIVGGSSADFNDHPHQASLQRSGSHICGASLVSAKWLITAAHCVDTGTSSPPNPADFTIKLGTNQHASGGTIYTVKKIIMHDGYNDGSGTYANDIALIELNNFVQGVSSIAMASSSDGDFAGQTCVITGWGKTSGAWWAGLSPSLQEVEMTVISNNNCGNQWSSQTILGSHVCIFQSDKSACNGDSGGPLVCNNKLVGATSWGSSTCSGTLPSVYTRISSFRSWIQQQAGI
uniref:Peptidase S1 domain-containing protein n=1 Tax=Pinctada fucata TaxID=50426 RepID=A0A194APL8_PINFU